MDMLTLGLMSVLVLLVSFLAVSKETYMAFKFTFISVVGIGSLFDGMALGNVMLVILFLYGVFLICDYISSLIYLNLVKHENDKTNQS